MISSERTRLFETERPNKDIGHRAGKDSYSSPGVCLLRPVTAISNLKNFYFLRKLWEELCDLFSLGGSLIKNPAVIELNLQYCEYFCKKISNLFFQER